MRIQPMTFECEQCKTRILGHIIVECSVKLFCLGLREYRCPEGCPSTKLMLLTTDPKDAIGEPDRIIEPT